MKNLYYRLLQTSILFFSLSTSSMLLSGTVEAKKDGVLVLDNPSKKGSVLKKLDKGESIEAKDRKGMYWEVEVDGKSGYVSVMSVNRKTTSSSNLSQALRKAVKQGRDEGDLSNARSRSTVMGVRGLDDSDETAFAGNAKPNLRMVSMMEDVVVESTQIEALGAKVFAEIEKKSE